MKQLPRFQQHNTVRKNILRHMKSFIQTSQFTLTDNNVEENPILKLFDSSTIQILGGFETRWMPDDVLQTFLLPDSNPEDWEAVLIRALPDTRSAMHIHEHGCSIITCLGESYGFPKPATELMHGHFVPQQRRQLVRRLPLTDNGFTFITPYVVHAFHTPVHGTSYALALATPRVKEDEGKFDFVILDDKQWVEQNCSI
jgi:hypothetical protein